MAGVPEFPHPLYDPGAITAETEMFVAEAREAFEALVLTLVDRDTQAIQLALAAGLAADLVGFAEPLIAGHGLTAAVVGEAVATGLAGVALVRFVQSRFAKTTLADAAHERRRLFDDGLNLQRQVAAQQLRSLNNAECEAGLRELGRVWACLRALNRRLQIDFSELRKHARATDTLGQVALTALTLVGGAAIAAGFAPRDPITTAVGAGGIVLSLSLAWLILGWSRSNLRRLTGLLAPLSETAVAGADPLIPIAAWIDEVPRQRNEHEAFFRRPMAALTPVGAGS
jgi:hypothetical protein